MELREIVAPTMKELFITEITRQILSGECEIGEKLPTEREMEKSMRVSRTIINSALSDLARMGFVKIVPRHGVFVEDFTRNGNIDTLITIMNFNGGKLDKRAYNSLMIFRLNTECECARLASMKRTQKDLTVLKEIREKIRVEKDYSEISKLKVDFHHAMYCATDNIIYPLVFNSFKKLSIAFNEIIFKNFGCEVANLYLDELINAIEDKNPDNASQVIKDLVAVRVQELSEYY